MSFTYVWQRLLILLWLGISFFWILYFSQEELILNTQTECLFVVGRNWDFCYVEGHHRKDLDIIQEFNTLKECEEYLLTY